MHILLVENDDQGAKTLAQSIERHGHEVTTVATGAAALEAHSAADLIVLDLGLRDIDGLEICRHIRSRSEQPIISLTEDGSDLDRILGLQAGSDDCLSRPFHIRELILRIDAVTRRTRLREISQRQQDSLSIGALSVNWRTREVRLNGSRVSLTRKEFDLIHYLVSHQETVVTRERLMAEVWDDSAAYTRSSRASRASRTIDTHVSSLRNKLGCSWILTVRGVGFRIGYGNEVPAVAENVR
jgi:DNA-binding response OmpR family regulator